MTVPKANVKANLKGFDAVEGILNRISNPPKEDVPVVTPSRSIASPNIKDIPVPDALVESVLTFAINRKEAKAKAEAPKEQIVEQKEEPEEVEEINEEVVAQDKLSNLVLRLSALLKEAKDFLNEMTTTGMIGTNQKFVLGKKKKNGLTKSNKRN
jgi:hypothetical protein